MKTAVTLIGLFGCLTFGPIPRVAADEAAWSALFDRTAGEFGESYSVGRRYLFQQTSLKDLSGRLVRNIFFFSILLRDQPAK